MSSRSRGRRAGDSFARRSSRGAGQPSPSGLRISAGELRGRRLTAREGVRPTESKVREALIDRWRPRLPEARVLDLFAGSGAVGFSALSCGAASCLFVDQDRHNLDAIASAATEWGISDRVRTVEGTLPPSGRSTRIDRECEGGFDLIFADPPYDFDQYQTLAEWAEPFLSDQGELVIEHSARSEVSEGDSRLEPAALKRYGECALSFFSARRVSSRPHSGEADQVASPDEQEKLY